MSADKKTQNKRRPRRKKGGKKTMVIVASVVAAMLIGAACLWLWWRSQCSVPYPGTDEVRVYVPYGATERSIADSLTSKLGADYANQVIKLWRWADGKAARAEGSYVVKPGMSAKTLSDKLRSGNQDALRVTFNNARTMQQLADKVTARLQISADDFLDACNELLPPMGYDQATFPAAFMPDTYEFYWNADAATVVRRLVSLRDRWWNADRTAKAKSLGLDLVQVATLASIVEEETAKADEKPKVARLYLNRLEKGMRLQADPTVKFAFGDFSLRRITNKHLGTESPYNTYLHEGLPPGPIRVPERASLEAVLDAPQHPYIYMCAKEDFSGYHNFAVTGAEHAANARRYHEELNRRNIK